MLAPLLYLAFATVVFSRFSGEISNNWGINNETKSIGEEVATTIVDFAVTTKKVKVKGK